MIDAQPSTPSKWEQRGRDRLLQAIGKRQEEIRAKPIRPPFSFPATEQEESRPKPLQFEKDDLKTLKAKQKVSVDASVKSASERQPRPMHPTHPKHETASHELGVYSTDRMSDRGSNLFESTGGSCPRNPTLPFQKKGRLIPSFAYNDHKKKRPGVKRPLAKEGRPLFQKQPPESKRPFERASIGTLTHPSLKIFVHGTGKGWAYLREKLQEKYLKDDPYSGEGPGASENQLPNRRQSNQE